MISHCPSSLTQSDNNSASINFVSGNIYISTLLSVVVVVVVVAITNDGRAGDGL